MAWRKLSELIGNPLHPRLAAYIRDPKYETRTGFIETFHTDFELLTRTYAEGKRVFVFLDDLDRCEVPKAADLMQAVNLLISESAPVFYILGLDREKIAAGLAAKYEKILKYLASDIDAPEGVVGAEFGYEFLEKFIQIPFLVPRPTERDLDKLLDALSDSGASQAEKKTASEVDAGLLVQVSADSDAVRNVVKMVAPALDNNPRRVKQFLNLFRLRALLASQTGLFGASDDPDRFDPLTFEKLGKLVAINLRWPRLLADAEEMVPTLLSELQREVWGVKRVPQPPGAPAIDSPVEPLRDRGKIVQYWMRNQNLLQLIAFPKGSEQDWNDGDERKYGLHRVDLQRIFQIAPLVRGRGLGETPVNGEQTRAAHSIQVSDTVRTSETTSNAYVETDVPFTNEAPFTQVGTSQAQTPSKQAPRPSYSNNPRQSPRDGGKRPRPSLKKK